MGRTGHTLENRALGHRVVFLKTAEETNGQMLQIEYIVTRREAKPRIPIHVHLVSEERFEVLRGQLGVWLSDTRRVLSQGESLRIPPGTPHTFWNSSEEELHFLTEIRPPGQFQTYWETLFGLAQDGKVNAQGLPNPFQLLVLAQIADSYPAGVHIGVARLIIGLMAPLAKLLGYRERYPRYSD
jgi:quercetin dioxygenase-like cupin family protein